jgi:Domain of unknown function (DUF4158)
MPVEFFTDDEAAAYGRFAGPPSQAELERVFFLDDEDRALAGQRRGQHMELGFALQLVTFRWLETFLEDPVRLLEGKSVDDTLELLDLLMATELVNKAQTTSNKEKVR